MRTNGVPFFTSHEGQTRFSFRLAAAIQAIESGCECIDADLLSDELVTHNLVSISDRRARRATG